jgi:hypothetical protein
VLTSDLIANVRPTFLLKFLSARIKRMLTYLRQIVRHLVCVSARSLAAGNAKSVRASSTLKTVVLPRLTTWVGPLTGAAGFTGTICAHHQIIKEHLNRCQVLLDRLRRTGMFFDIGCDVHRRNGPDVIDVVLGPRQKLGTGPCVSLPGVQVPNPGREKLEELRGGVFARIGQDRGHSVGVAEGHTK